MKIEKNFDFSFCANYNRNVVALIIGILTFGVYWLMLSPVAYPGSSAKIISICLGLNPSLTPDHPLWMSCLRGARFLPPGIAVYLLNLSSALCGAMSVALLFRYLSRWVERRVILDGGLTDYTPRLVGLVAGLMGALALCSTVPFRVAATRLNVFSFDAVLILLAFNLLQDNIDHADRWRPFALAFLCGVGCTESPLFLLMTPFFAIMLMVDLYKRQQATSALYPKISAGQKLSFGVL